MSSPRVNTDEGRYGLKSVTARPLTSFSHVFSRSFSAFAAARARAETLPPPTRGSRFAFGSVARDAGLR